MALQTVCEKYCILSAPFNSMHQCKACIALDREDMIFVGELGKNLSPSNLRRFWDYHEFGNMNEKGPSNAFCFVISEERGLNIHEL
jgi:hypothetical protein